MKTQYKISYYTINGLKDSFYEFHSHAPSNVEILGGYMKDVIKVEVKATGLTTDNIEAARMAHCPHILNFIAGNAPAPHIDQEEIDMLDLGTFGHDGYYWSIKSENGTVVATKTGREYCMPFVSKQFYPA